MPAPAATRSLTLYRYGLLAWVWRVLIAMFLALGGVVVYAAATSGASILFVAAGALIVPAVFFGSAVVVRADRVEGGLDVWTLIGWRRRIATVRMEPPRVRRAYEDGDALLHAPRAWIPVKGSCPLYFDLLADIPDRQAFLAAIKLSAASIRAS